MKLQYHIALSLPVSAAVYALSHSKAMAAASFLAGVFTDIDHVFDYMREYGLRCNPHAFFRSFSNTLYRKVVLPFHSWEIAVLLAAGAIASHGDGAITGTLIGFAIHLAADQMTNGPRAAGYFFTYRAVNGFVAKRIFPGKGIE